MNPIIKEVKQVQKIDKTDTLETILTKGRFEVDYYQREYRWGRVQIDQMLTDFYDTFRDFYDPSNHDSPAEVQNYGYYYMGSIICTGSSPRQIIDGQQRITSLTLLLIYLRNLQQQTHNVPYLPVPIDNLIYKNSFGTMAFNLDVPERNDCMTALWNENKAYAPTNESTKNLVERYGDIEDLFPDELKGEALPYFIYWLTNKVLLLEIDTPSEDEAHTIFLTMNDRGLSLNSAEMLKAFIIQQVDEKERDFVNKQWQDNINSIKAAFGAQSSGTVKAEDVDFISAWLRAKYAESIRETKKGAEDRDFEKLGEKFHTWVRQNTKSAMKLSSPLQYKDLVSVEMSLMTKLYLRIKQYSENLTSGYEAVFYNAHRDITYQNYLIMSAVCVSDTKSVIDQKIKIVSTFIDIFASTRIFNYKKINWNTNKQMLFKVMCQIRNQDVKTVGIILTSYLERMNEKLDAIKDFELNQFTGRYMLHMLARLTDFVYLEMGYASNFSAYIDRNPKTSYDIEHILPDAYSDYVQFFNDEEDFNRNRQKVGNLILLTSDHNRSYQSMKYEDKVTHYPNDNILAQSLNPTTYTNNPKFLAIKDKYGFEPLLQFDKAAIKSRLSLYSALAKAIWDTSKIKKLAGGWDDALEIKVQSGSGKRYTVEYGGDRSWEDAERFGFVSADSASLGNINKGDFVFCHIKGAGFVGVGVCVGPAVPGTDFMVEDNGVQKNIMDCSWVNLMAKAAINASKEMFLQVNWIRTTKRDLGYWEKGMTSVPLVAYVPTDGTTHDMVLKHFSITLT